LLIFYSDNHYYEKFEKSEPIDITDEIPFEVPESWSWCRVGNIEEINLGFTYRPNYTNEGVYFLSVKDISNGKIDFSNAKKVSKETYDNASYGSKPQKGDILFGRVGTMGKPQIIETNEKFCIFVSLGFFRDHLNIINKKYIVLWMESFLFQQQVNKNVKGAAQKNLNTGWLKDFLIPIPPLNEQERIVERFALYEPYFEKYNNTYNKLEELNSNYKEELKKSILQYAIQGKLVKQNPNDESAEILINKILDEKRELIKTKQIKKEDLSVIYKDPSDNQFYEKFDDGKIVNITEEIPFEIPDSWRWIKLKTIAFVTKLAGFEYTKNIFPNLTKSGIPLFKGKNVQNGKLVLDFESYIPEQVSTDLPRSQLTKKCLLTPYVGTIGNIAIFDGSFKAHLGSNVGKIELYGNILEEYILYYLRSYTGNCELKKFKKATAQESISIDALRECYIALPPLNEQNRIVEKIKNIFEYIETAE